MFQTLFPNNDAASETTVPQFTHLELFSHGLKSMKVNFNIFTDQYNHKISTSMNFLITFGDYSEEQSPTPNICKAT
jgi:hypothetical protein